MVQAKMLLGLVMGVAALAITAGCTGTSHVSVLSSTTVQSSTSTSVATESVSLPVVSCPTTFAITAPSTSAPLPSSENENIPARLANQLSIYSDNHGLVMLLGPRGWSCTASFGADGSGGVGVFPPGESVPVNSWGAGWNLLPDSSIEAIVGSETSACQGCAVGQACRLFPAAATAFRNLIGSSCPTRPKAEEVEEISAGVGGFEDPPGVAGDGSPSGGRYRADGVMTYYPQSAEGSWVETCTLPASEHELCTASLDNFVSSYGQK